jgi:hypothetical protein
MMNNDQLDSYFAGTANMLNSLADKVEAIRLALVATVPGFEAAYATAIKVQEPRSTFSTLETRPSSPEQALQVAHLIADLRGLLDNDPLAERRSLLGLRQRQGVRHHHQG